MNRTQDQSMMLTEIMVEDKSSIPILDPTLKHEMLKELEP